VKYISGKGGDVLEMGDSDFGREVYVAPYTYRVLNILPLYE